MRENERMQDGLIKNLSAMRKNRNTKVAKARQGALSESDAAKRAASMKDKKNISLQCVAQLCMHISNFACISRWP